MDGIVLGIIALLSPAFCQLSDIDVACGSSQPLQLQKTQGDLYSPGYIEKLNYPPNTQCSYRLIVSNYNYKKVLLEIKFMDIEASPLCSNDFLKIEDGIYKTNIGQFCASNITEKMLITTDNLTITFVSDDIISGKGFHLSYEVTSQKSLCEARHLQCKNNKCVPSSAICNQKDDCGDGTDEEDCRQKLNQRADCGVPKIAPLLDDSTDRIVGGQEAIPGSWPWQADLQFAIIRPNGHACGATLINSQWVVTAAHCVMDMKSAETLRIVLGNHNKYLKDPHEQIRYGGSIEVYPYKLSNGSGFKEELTETINNDIALIKLNAEVEFTSHVIPACLPPAGFEPKIGTKCVTTGWGMSRGSGGSSVLKQVHLKIVPISDCDNPYFELNPNTMICADSDENHGGSCHYDSGGPLVCEEDGRWYIVGITSFGTLSTLNGGICGVQNIPSVYQKVSPKTSWIQSVLTKYA